MKIESYSMVVPVKDVAPKYLMECLQSVAEQDAGCQIQTVVVDDGSSPHSSDQYVQIVEGLSAESSSNRSWIFERMSTSRGIAAARNRGAAIAESDYFGFLDSDDILRADAVRRSVAAHAEGPSFVFTDHVQTSEDLKETLRNRQKTEWYRHIQEHLGTDCDPFLHATFLIHFHSISSDLFGEIGGWKESIDYGDEIDLHLRLGTALAPEMVGHVPHAVYLHRHNPAGVSNNPRLYTRLISNIEALLAAEFSRRHGSAATAQRNGRCARTGAALYSYLCDDGSTFSPGYIGSNGLIAGE